MKRTNTGGNARRRYYGRYIAHYTKKNYVVMGLALLFLAGVLLGAFLVRSVSEETMQTLLRMLGDFSQRRRGQTFGENLLSSLTSPLNYLIVLFICGFCAIAQPVEMGLLLFRGLGFGFSAASLYAMHGPSAAGFVGVFLLPGMVLTTIAMVLCCKEAMRMSGSLWGLSRGADVQPYSLRIYCARFVVAGIFCGVSAFVEAGLFFLFSSIIVL